MNKTFKFNLKGNIMTNKQLNDEVSKMRLIINKLKDEVHLLKNELNRFKGDVASDVRYLTSRVDG